MSTAARVVLLLLLLSSVLDGRDPGLCLLDLGPADVSGLIVGKLNRSSGGGPAGACSQYDFP